MGNIIYWKEFDKPKTVRLIIGEGRTYEATGEYLCNDERVDICGFYRGASANPLESNLNIYFGVLLKNGQRLDWKLDSAIDIAELEASDDPQSFQREHLILQAEQYLQQLK